MFRKVIVLFGCALCFVFTVCAVDVSAKSAILYEADSGKILYQKDIHTQREIASTTKIMTALLALENASQDDVVYIKPEYTGAEGTSIYLKQGEEITVRTLLHGLMLQSGNDAAVALAHHIAGDEESFVNMMNLKAMKIGLKNTHFENPNGLPSDGHYSTAYDMALLTAYAMKNKDFCDIVAKTSYQCEGRAFANHNKLLKMSSRVNGVKTGFTKSAGRCLVSSAEEDGMRLIAVTLSAPDDWNDHLALFDYGFSTYSKQIYIKKGEVISHIPVVNGIEKRISVTASEDVYIIKSNNNTDAVQVKVYLPHFVYAPLGENQKIGEIRLTNNGEIISKTDILNLNAVEVAEIKTIRDKFKDFFANLFK